MLTNWQDNVLSSCEDQELNPEDPTLDLQRGDTAVISASVLKLFKCASV